MAMYDFNNDGHENSDADCLAEMESPAFALHALAQRGCPFTSLGGGCRLPQGFVMGPEEVDRCCEIGCKDVHRSDAQK